MNITKQDKQWLNDHETTEDILKTNKKLPTNKHKIICEDSDRCDECIYGQLQACPYKRK